MNRFRELERYPKILLIALLLMAVVFAPIYGITASRVGFLHNDEIFIPRQENGVTLYEARADGQDCVFTVTGDTVTLVWGRTYGPYTIREDPTAVPDDVSSPMTGIEILDGQRVYFRGGVTDEATAFWLRSEDGNNDFMISYTMSDGIEYDMDGNPVDPRKPTAYQIISLLRTPKLTHRGQWEIFFMALLSSALTAFSILFADELFYLRLAFRVRDAEYAEPSDWELTTRAIGWTILAIAILVAYLVGLRVA